MKELTGGPAHTSGLVCTPPADSDHATGSHGISTFDSMPDPFAAPLLDRSRHALRNTCYPSSTPLVEVISSEPLLVALRPARIEPLEPDPVIMPTSRRASRVRPDTLDVSMVYNEYGELVDANANLNSPTTSELSVTEILRVIKKAFRHDVSIIPPLVRVSSWRPCADHRQTCSYKTSLMLLYSKWLTYQFSSEADWDKSLFCKWTLTTAL